MTDSEKIQILLEKSAIMEEAIKMLLVNDVLKDAENLTGQNPTSVLQGELQQKIDKLQKLLKTKEEQISSLQNQLETQKGRIKTLQELSDSKDRTIRTKEERIQVLQQSVKTKDDSISRLQTRVKSLQESLDSKDRTIQNLQKSSNATSSYSRTSSQSSFQGFKVGQQVKIRSTCNYCYDSAYNQTKKKLPLYNPSSYVCTIQEVINDYCTNPPSRLYRLYTRNQFGQEFRFWIDADMVIPA